MQCLDTKYTRAIKCTQGQKITHFKINPEKHNLIPCHSAYGFGNHINLVKNECTAFYR